MKPSYVLSFDVKKSFVAKNDIYAVLVMDENDVIKSPF